MTQERCVPTGTGQWHMLEAGPEDWPGIPWKHSWRAPAAWTGDAWINDFGLNFSTPEEAAAEGWSYVGPITPPEVVDALVTALEGLEPYLDAIVCFASTMDEYEPNRLAKAARDAIKRARAA